MRKARSSFLALVTALALALGLVSGTVVAASHRATTFHVMLTGAQEATPVCSPPAVCGDPDAVARMNLVLIPALDRVCFVTKWATIDGTVVAAHIHVAAAGVPGPVVVPLFSGTFAGTDRTRDCVSANGLTGAIAADPSAYYVNIHSTTFPAGAVRAQLG
jgi:hypothetical protein